MKIAIASTGLGNITRGIETWALDTANALHRRDIDVTLFAAAPVPAEATLHTIRCLRRGTPLNRFIVRIMPPFTWRWGLKSDYALEQRTFWRGLRKQLNRGAFDILHVQDPVLADLCRRARKAGTTNTRVILAHGTEEPLPFLAPFEYLQHLAPWHLEQSLAQLRARDPAQPTPAHWAAIPNFVNTDCFYPVANQAARQSLRREIGLPEDAFIFGTAAAIKKNHKRIDYLIHEFALAIAAHPGLPLHLVIAGSRHSDMPELQSLAEQRCKGRVTFLPNYPHNRMPDLLRTLDVFILTSLFEMMPIALLEAIATGLPVITNNHPVLEWMGGAGGLRLDMQKSGALAQAITDLTPETLTRLGEAARSHALEQFSEPAVIQHYITWYHQILAR